MAQTCPTYSIPEATVALAKMRFEEDLVYQFIGDVLFDQFRDDMLFTLIVGAGV